jgi:DNA-binding transcriptional ArsR family regulator
MSAESSVLPELRLERAPPDVEGPLAIAVLVADRNRATILAILRDGPHCVCELAAALHEHSNNVSNHLARLREAGLVRASRQSADTRRMYYERDEVTCAAALAELRSLLGPAQ